VQLVLPTMRGNTVKMNKLNLEYVGPKRMLNQVLGRPGSTSSKKLTTSSLQAQGRPGVPERAITTRPSAPSPSCLDRMGVRPAPLRAATRV